jgi:YgiT-type zinc finger domain-containing protein
MSVEFRPPASRSPYPSRCVQCGGTVVEQFLTLSYPSDPGQVRLIRRAPVGVCASCGERYLKPRVAVRIEQLLSTPPEHREEVPVWDYAAEA